MTDIQIISLDIHDNKTYEQVFQKQYNEKTKLCFRITCDGKEYDLTGATAAFQMKKPDNTVIINDCIIENNKVIVEVTKQMTAVYGNANFEITLFDGNGVIISTITATMRIDEAVIHPDDIKSEDEFNFIVNALKEITLIKLEIVDIKTYVEELADKAETFANKAAASATSASDSADIATEKATESATSASNANKSEENANIYAQEASNSASIATQKATQASTSANNAETYSNQASDSATSAQNYAIGITDSAKYYYEQAKTISESLSGALRPKGTIIFSNLPDLADASEGDMYNISDSFTTTTDFKEGSGNIIPAGSNVYKTSDGKWDILAGTPVVGVKGNAETTYRRGNVNITAQDIGFEIVSDSEPIEQEVGCYWLVDY